MTRAVCAICEDGPAIRQVPGYAIEVCTTCWEGAQAGWPSTAEARLFAALAAAGLLIPDRNDAGRLPRCYAPPADFRL